MPCTHDLDIAANAIGYEMFRHDRPVYTGPAGVDTIDVNDEEAARCRAAAERVFDHLGLTT